MTTKTPEFCVGRLFPADDPKRTAAVRLVVAAQGLISLSRLLGPTLPDTKAYRETKHYIMLLSLGLANESAAGFEAARHKGVFDEVHPFPNEDTNARFGRLVEECDRNNPQSLRSRLVAFGRNKLAFHWDEKVIRKALKELATYNLPAWAGAEDETYVTTALPIAEAVTITALGLHVGDKEALNRIMQEVATFQGDLLHVSHALYTSLLVRYRDEAKSA